MCFKKGKTSYKPGIFTPPQQAVPQALPRSAEIDKIQRAQYNTFNEAKLTRFRRICSKKRGDKREKLFICPFVQLVIIVFAKRTSGISHYNAIHKCPNSNVHTLDFLEKALPHIFLVQTMK